MIRFFVYSFHAKIEGHLIKFYKATSTNETLVNYLHLADSRLVEIPLSPRRSSCLMAILASPQASKKCGIFRQYERERCSGGAGMGAQHTTYLLKPYLPDDEASAANFSLSSLLCQQPAITYLQTSLIPQQVFLYTVLHLKRHLNTLRIQRCSSYLTFSRREAKAAARHAAL